LPKIVAHKTLKYGPVAPICFAQAYEGTVCLISEHQRQGWHLEMHMITQMKKFDPPVQLGLF
jgi:hypothetical protein